MNKDAFDDCMGDLPDSGRGYLTEVTAPPRCSTTPR